MTLGDLTKNTRPICYGVLKPGPFAPDGVPLVRIQDLSGTTVRREALHYISMSLDEEFARSRLAGGEVLLSIQGTIGRTAIVPDDLAGANISRTVAVVDPDERLDKRFLVHYFEHVSSRDGFETTGSTRRSLNISTIRLMQVPVPPLPEQQQIVAAVEEQFSRLDAAEASLDRVADATGTLMSAALSTLAHTGDWPVHTLGEVADWGSGGTPKSTNPAFYGGTIPWAVIGDLNDGVVTDTHATITEDGLKNSSAKLVGEDTVMIAMYGSIGRLGIAGTTMATNQAIAWAVPHLGVVSRDYLYWYLRSQRIFLRSKAQGTTQGNISQTLLKGWTIPVPPVEVQNRVVEQMKEYESVIQGSRNIVGEAMRRSGALRASILRDAFSGCLTRGPHD
jgi:restriction endonuclease S subunit